MNSTERPSVTVVYQDAQHTGMGCLEIALSVGALGILAAVVLGLPLWKVAWMFISGGWNLLWN